MDPGSIIYGIDVMYIMKKVYFLLFLILFTGLAFAKAEPKFTEFVVPDNYFEFPVPDGWEFVSVEWLGERTYLFSPAKVTREELERGVNLQSLQQIYHLNDGMRSSSIQFLQRPWLTGSPIKPIS